MKFLIIILFANLIFSQSPKNLIYNVGQDIGFWTDNVNSYDDIEVVFNNARRNEELQFGLAENSLGNLELPSLWTDKTVDEKILYLLNQERFARGGINYGDGEVLGLPFKGIEANIDNIAQSHANNQLLNNSFSHIDSDGFSSFERIDNDEVLGGCHQHMSYSENISGFWSQGGVNEFVAEKSVYFWLYEDMTSNWGHRKAVLIQNYDSYNGIGFNNDYGDEESEGFIGIGVVSSPSYNPFGYSGVTDGDLIVFNVYDPDQNCLEILSIDRFDESKANEIKITPNPVVGNEIILSNLSNDSIVSVFDIYGKLLLEKKIKNPIGQKLFEIKEIVLKGIYFIVINDRKGNIRTFKLLKK